MLGLATVLIFVFFFVERRNEEVEDEMITKVKDRMKLTGSDSSSKPPWEVDEQNSPHLHFLLDRASLVPGILVIPPAKKQERRVEDILRPIRKESLKDVFVTRFEDLILSGKFSIGEKLPSERELALRLGVSRPVVHDGLMDLVSKGLVSMKPRVGTVVNDYRREGSLSILTSLVNYQNGKLDPRLFESMVEMRMLFEVETARLAASRRTPEHLDALERLARGRSRGGLPGDRADCRD